MSRPPRRGHPAQPGPAPHAPPGAAGSPRAAPSAAGAWTAATAALAALAAIVFATVALALHPVGDYFTESDFYGYAWGARLIQSGHLDFSRFSVVGPVYELLLAACAPLVGDAFRAAQLLSALAGAATLLAWAGIVRRLAARAPGAAGSAGADHASRGAPAAAAGLWTALFLATNPVVLRYATSATTDMPAVALQSAAVFALLAARGRRAPLVAGALAALAALTRYSGLYLVPAALLRYALWPDAAVAGARPRRLGAIAGFLAGFAIPALPWLALSLAHGEIPGATLVRSFSYYADPSAGRNVQDLAPGVAATGYRSLGEVLAAAPGAFFVKLASGLREHLVRDARDLLGGPAALACLVGLALAGLRGAWRGLLPAWLTGTLLLLTLAPVFYSARYALPIAPFYLSLAGLAAGLTLAWPGLTRGRLPLPWVALAIPLVLGVRAGIAEQRWLASPLPVEVKAAGEALRRDAAGLRPSVTASPPATGVGAMSRKMHLWYYSGLDPVAFPRVATLAALADDARRNGARYLFFSWYEAELRPEFWYLLDTTATVPGLERIPFAARNPAVLYRLGPEFGRDPAWMASDSLRRLHVARAQVQVLNDRDAWGAHFTLGEAARARGDLAAALPEYQAAARGNPGLALIWQRAGATLLALGRIDEARTAYERARRLVPGDPVTMVGIGWAQLRSGHPDLAAATWRPLVSQVSDPATLRAMAEAFANAGDAAGVTAALQRIAEVGKR